MPLPDPVPLDFQEKRQILHGKGQDARRLGIAQALVAEGRLAESLEYLERTRDETTLLRVRAGAVKAGDGFTLARACQILRAEPGAEEWRALAAAAEGAGKWYDAVNALERAGDAEKAGALRAQHCPDYTPFKPAGK